MTAQRVLVTGASGFVGQHLCRHLADAGHDVLACVRPHSKAPSVPNVETGYVEDLHDEQRWANVLADVDSVVHLAARVHVMNDTAADPLAEFRRVNVEGTAAVARAAAKAGVRRFVALSSIKVNGEATGACAFRADDTPGFLDPYGQSKWEAERVLAQIAERTGMQWTVVRPTLVYGPGVRGNFFALLRHVNRGVPLPLGGVHNRRSLVSVYNLVDLITAVLDHPEANGQTFLVKDPEDLSTAELIRRIARAFDRRPRLLPVPAALLAKIGTVLRQEKAVQRLLGSLVVDAGKTEDLLGWRAPVSIDEALSKTCSWYQTLAPTSGRL